MFRFGNTIMHYGALNIAGVSNSSDTSASNTSNIRCPHCHLEGSFPPAINKYLKYDSRVSEDDSHLQEMAAFIRICPNLECRGLIFIVEATRTTELAPIVYPPELLDFSIENLPQALAVTLKEAVVCHSQAAYRASAMMVRRLLEELCDDCGAEGKSLFLRLQGLRDKITLPEDLFDAMDELKALGNDAAHVEAKAYAEIDAEESQLSIDLAKEILKARYQHKSLVDRLKARRK